MCFGNEGTWKPTRLNECFKFGKYLPGGHFSPHIDGPWVPRYKSTLVCNNYFFKFLYKYREDESSIYTVIIYLNSNFEGGGTNFLHEGGEEGGKVAFKVQPETGMALIFNHDVLHEGEAVKEGNP